MREIELAPPVTMHRLLSGFRAPRAPFAVGGRTLQRVVPGSGSHTGF